jgi:glycosyltransferase involved in cell wall biosynthesis
MRKVIHLLPYDGIGGAEAAARSMASSEVDGIDFQIVYLFPRVKSQLRRAGTFNPFTFLGGVVRVVNEKPDLLVLSLWRSCLAGVVVKLIRPRTRLAVMVHNSVDAHLADRWATQAAIALSDGVWSDSEASINARFPNAPGAPVKVISFLTHHLRPLRGPQDPGDPAPRFVFWGRLAPQKNLFRALGLFRRIHQLDSQADFTIIGPDSGQMDALRQWCAREGLAEAVHFAGPMAPDGIRETARDKSFYLQTSDYEGMAMSVVEAMQLGLVPVVTPVGEIGRYCRNGENAVIVDGEGNDAVARIVALLADPPSWRRLRGNAIATWRDRMLYRDAFAIACRELLDAPNH